MYNLKYVSRLHKWVLHYHNTHGDFIVVGDSKKVFGFMHKHPVVRKW